MTTQPTSVILAAGKGTRMNSKLPKVLHPLLGRPMILYAVEAAEAATGRPPVLVVGHGAEQVRRTVGDRARYVHQAEQKGTAHAVMQAESLLRGQADIVLVTSGDMPLFTPSTLANLIAVQAAGTAAFTMLTVEAEDPRGFGRIVRDADGRVVAIVEEAVAAPEQLAIRELNVGAYAFDGRWLWDALRRIELSPKGEYYLTDLVAVAVRMGLPVQAVTAPDANETIGINTPAHLAEAERTMSARRTPATPA